jgi:hypothetical protein
MRRWRACRDEEDSAGFLLASAAGDPVTGRKHHPSEEVHRLADEAHAEVTHLLSDHRDELDSLAHALLNAETLDAPDAYAAAGVPMRPGEHAAAHGWHWRPAERGALTGMIAIAPARVIDLSYDDGDRRDRAQARVETRDELAPESGRSQISLATDSRTRRSKRACSSARARSNGTCATSSGSSASAPAEHSVRLCPAQTRKPHPPDHQATDQGIHGCDPGAPGASLGTRTLGGSASQQRPWTTDGILLPAVTLM